MREIVTVLVVLVAAFLGWLAFGGGPELASVLVADELAPAERSDRTADVDAELSQPALEEPAIENRSAPEHEARESAAAKTSEKVGITGTVVLRNAASGVFAEESGVLRISIASEAERGREVAVEAGRFAFELAHGLLFQIESVELGGIECALSNGAQPTVADRALHLELEVFRRVPATLVVRDRASGADIAGLELWNDEGWSLTPSLIPVRPSQTQIEVPNLSSPVRLPVREGQQTWWVRSEGYAWETVQFDHRSGGERIVVLDREATLSVHVENRVGGEALDVFLTKDHFAQRSHSFTVGASEPSEFQVGGLIGGACVLKVGRTREEGRERFVTQDVVLVAGEVTTARLTLPPLSSANSDGTVLVSGTLELPPSNTQSPSLLRWSWRGDKPGPEQSEVTADFEPMAPDSNRWSWKTKELIPGPWQVSVTPFGYVEDLYIGPAGATDIALRIASLVEVSVRVQNKDTGAPIPDPEVSFYRKGGEFDAYGGSARRTEEPGVAKLVLAPGAYRFGASGEGFLSDGRTITVGTTNQEVLFELTESASLVVVLMEGTTVVPREMTWWLAVKAEHLGGEGRIASRSFSSRSASMSAGVSEPGLYRLTFGEIDGYLPIEPLEVLLDHGEKKIEVQLTRK